MQKFLRTARQIGVRAGGARAAMLLLGGAFAAGCGTLDRINEANRVDYKSSAPARRSTLDVPPDLSAPRTDDRFAIPGAGAPGDATTASSSATLSAFQRSQAASAAQRPADARVLPSAEGARLERLGNQRWLVVDRPPEQLWPLVRNFWAENGFTIATENPQLGIIETDWAENRAKLPQDLVRRTVGRVIPGLYDTSERDMFRTRLEPAPGGGTEIHLSHRGAEEVATGPYKDQVRWQPRANDPELEAEFLRRMLIKLGADQQRAEQVMAAAADPAPARARIEGDALQVDEGFDRAWRRVGVALDRAGFTVEDRDRSQGLFYVRFADVEGRAAAARNSKPGFLDRLFGRNKEAAADARRYRIRVQGEGDAAQVRVLDGNGAAPASADDRRIAGRILTLLQEQLR